MNTKLQSLLDAVNGVYPGEVLVRVGAQAKGDWQPGMVEQSVLGTRLLVELPDATAADFQIGDSLLQMLLSFNNAVPQIFFALTFNDQALDEQLIAYATRLYQTVMHAITYPELAKKDLLTADVKQSYLAGLQAAITPETGDIDDESLWRLVHLLDAQVLFAKDKAVLADLQTAYPLAFKASADLMAPILAEDLTQGRLVRKRIVGLFAGVDDILTSWGKPTLNAREYVTLSSVFSERQLSLPVKQVFDIYHSEMLDFRTQARAFVGLNKSDRQNSFTVSAPTDGQSPAFFTELYALTVKELFEQLGLPYMTR